jgi:DNA integrity scanning protein DisA with diadenylate cyclase activity
MATAESKHRVLGFLSLAVIVTASGFFFWLVLVPPYGPTFTHPSVWDEMVDSRFIIGVVRLIGLVVALYLVISVVALIAQQRWLTAAGPFQTETRRAVNKTVEEHDQLAEQLEKAKATITEQTDTIRELRDALVALSQGQP